MAFIKKLYPTPHTAYSKRGFTLIEIIIATGIFSILSMVIVGVFLSSLQAQGVVLEQKTLSENIRFALEFSSRQMRFAKTDTAGVCVAVGDVFLSTNSNIRFLNPDNVCVNISLVEGSIIYQEGSGAVSNLTDDSVVSVQALNFIVRGNGEQPRVTMIIDGVSPKDAGIGLRAQTTTTLRNLQI